jgi:hypothetical protein
MPGLLSLSVAVTAMGAFLSYLVLIALPISGWPALDELPIVLPAVIVLVIGFVFIGFVWIIYLQFTQTPPTWFELDRNGLTASTFDGREDRFDWSRPRSRLILADYRSLFPWKVGVTTIQRASSPVPYAIPAELFDAVVSELTHRGYSMSRRKVQSRFGSYEAIVAGHPRRGTF